MLALGYALDKIIPDPYPQRRQQPPKAPTLPRENPTATPATPKNNHRPGSLLLDMDDAERWLE